MRIINMHRLNHIRRQYAHKKTLIGKGSFASVYAADGDDTVTKITLDQISYALLADGYWLSVREPAEAFFPKLIQDFGAVGTQNESSVYAVELERLKPVSGANRKKVLSWTRQFDAVSSSKGYRLLSPLAKEICANFCYEMAERETECSSAFSALADFVINFDCNLDFKPSNFMERSDGSLVFNDVVFDGKAYMREINNRPYY